MISHETLHVLVPVALIMLSAVLLILIRQRRERERIAHSLAASEARYQSVLSAMTEGVVMQDANGRVVTFNSHASRILGLTEGQLSGRDSMDSRWGMLREDGSALPGDEHPAMVALHSGRPVRDVVIGAHLPDGSRAWLRVNSSPIFDAGAGRPSAVVTTFSDVTESLRVAVALRANEMRLRAIIESVPAMIAYWDHDLLCVFANQAYAAWVGIECARLTGMHAHDILGQRLYAVSEPHMRGALRGEVQKFERVHYDAQGRARRAAVTYVPDCVGDEIKGFFILLTDITELSQLVEERTSELRVARDQAQAAHRAKDDFFANASHEMRTPLHAILAFTELGLSYLEQVPDAKLSKYLRNTEQSARRLGRFVDQLLSLSKFQAGQVTPNLARLNLREQIDAIHAVVEPLLANKGLRLDIDSQKVDPVIEADAHMIDQVITNLLSNAIKFSPQGAAIALTLSDDRLESSGGSSVAALCIAIRDQGIGIPEKELESIFNKFEQSSRTKTGAGGTGLGLSICREIAYCHGGSVEAQNNAQGGACFTLRLPRRALVRIRAAA